MTVLGLIGAIARLFVFGWAGAGVYYKYFQDTKSPLQKPVLFAGILLIGAAAAFFR